MKGIGVRLKAFVDGDDEPLLRLLIFADMAYTGIATCEQGEEAARTIINARLGTLGKRQELLRLLEELQLVFEEPN